MKAIDLFAGWGGFTLGAEQAGAEEAEGLKVAPR